MEHERDRHEGRPRSERRAKVDDRHNKQRVFWRTVVLMVLFGVVAFVPLMWKLWDIQINQHDELQRMAVDQQTRDLAVSADRGRIYDAEGNILSISATVQNLVLSPKDLNAAIQANEEKAAAGKQSNPSLNKEFIAQGLAGLTGLDAGDILQRMEKTTSQYEVLVRKLEQEQSEPIRAFIVNNKLGNGVYLEPDTKRY